MMGLQATPGKRKLEAAAAAAPHGESSPPKSGRWEADDCIARLQAVAVPGDAWRTPAPSLAATLLSTSAPDDYEDDEDEFEDDLSEDDDHHLRGGNAASALRGAAGTAAPEAARFGPPPPHQQQQQSFQPRYAPADYWQYYQPPQQQTIRCEENGKSYLELGASPPPPPVRTRCCDGRTRWCHVPCYRQRRLAVLNLSMCKLARYRQCSDPSLRRSVLICNTLRRLEREMEAEPPEQPSYPPGGLPEMSLPSRLAPAQPLEPTAYEQSLREMACASGRATPFPSAAPDTDSGLGDDEMTGSTGPINWGSVLSLTSQTDLESLNNNELYAELGLSSDPPEWKELPAPSPALPRAQDNEWDGFMHVLVGGT